MNAKLSLPKETIHRLTGSNLPGGVARNAGLQGGGHPRAAFHETESFTSLSHTLIPTYND
jgi:hypothetical protein